MDNMQLHSMKEIKIVIEGEHLHFVTNVLDEIEASGYTIFNNISGKGHGGFQKGHLMYNDTNSLQMVLSIVPEEKVEPILYALKPFLECHSGSLFVLDTNVLRQDRFATKCVEI
jgi:nitrogen regulatory protein PII